MRTFAFFLAFLVSSLSANSQVTFADLTHVNDILDGTTEQVPDAYRKVHDFLLSKGMMLKSYSIGIPAIQVDIPRPPQPAGLKEVNLQYAHITKGNDEIVKIIVSQRVDSASKQYVQYYTELTTNAFSPYVQWRIDAQANLKSASYAFVPFVDTFAIPPKSGTSKTVRILISSVDQYSTRTAKAPYSYLMVIDRIKY